VVLEGAFAGVVVDGDVRVVNEVGEVVEVAEVVPDYFSRRVRGQGVLVREQPDLECGAPSTT
jgi:hypothetical protein